MQRINKTNVKQTKQHRNIRKEATKFNRTIQNKLRERERERKRERLRVYTLESGIKHITSNQTEQLEKHKLFLSTPLSLMSLFLSAS